MNLQHAIDLHAGGPGSGRHPGFGEVRKAIKEKGFAENKGKFQSGTPGRRYHYDHPDGGFYKVTHRVDDTGSPKEVGTWMYRGKDGAAKGKDGQSLMQHLGRK